MTRYHVLYLLLSVEHLEANREGLPRSLGDLMRSFHHIELHAVVHGVRVYFPQTHYPVVELDPRVIHDQSLRVGGQEAALLRVENTLSPHVVREGRRRGRQPTWWLIKAFQGGGGEGR